MNIPTREEALAQVKQVGYVRIGEHSASSAEEVEKIFDERAKAWESAPKAPRTALPVSPLLGAPAIPVIDYDKLAEEIDATRIVIDYDKLAAEVDMARIEIDYKKLAQEVVAVQSETPSEAPVEAPVAGEGDAKAKK